MRPIIIFIWRLSKHSVFICTSFIPSFHQHHFTPPSVAFRPGKHSQNQIPGEAILYLCYGSDGCVYMRREQVRAEEPAVFFFFSCGGTLARECASQSQISEGWWSALCGHAAACGLRRWSGRKTANVDFTKKRQFIRKCYLFLKDAFLWGLFQQKKWIVKLLFWYGCACAAGDWLHYQFEPHDGSRNKKKQH